nr:carboxypeptidase-like regulatory domain-containing protein [uncultured Methanolobus sp.]
MDSLRLMKILVLLSMVFTICIPAASAHRVYVQETITEIEIKSWFGGGDPMADADVRIYAIKNGEEELYIEDKTDSDGLYYFTPKLGVSEYRVEVSESGHKSEETFTLTGDAVGDTSDAELPLAARIGAGFGYIIGIAGIAMYLSARKSRSE